MKNFYEAVLKTNVSKELSKAYKNALEIENGRKWVENPMTINGETTTNVKPVWGGCYANVDITESKEEGKAELILTLVSRTLPNLKEAVKSYERDGFEVIQTNY
ncbi:hypothetical protein [Enterococcus mundtii]|uniref:Uncharacterized protein n=1 Tax=Enterococcus mundtii TaxID=53346 RepID=A0A2S7RUA2_ENTMU|nr:hypothetical protein [Enterococcus mundtii]MBO1087032.1 hypothetical protein [Enterococcus mundtii]PQF23373.1 hypothetical protein CUS89_07330 [Enterococcus mundtii]